MRKLIPVIAHSKIAHERSTSNPNRSAPVIQAGEEYGIPCAPGQRQVMVEWIKEVDPRSPLNKYQKMGYEVQAQVNEQIYIMTAPEEVYETHVAESEAKAALMRTRETAASVADKYGVDPSKISKSWKVSSGVSADELKHGRMRSSVELEEMERVG